MGLSAPVGASSSIWENGLAKRIAFQNRSGPNISIALLNCPQVNTWTVRRADDSERRRFGIVSLACLAR